MNGPYGTCHLLTGGGRLGILDPSFKKKKKYNPPFVMREKSQPPFELPLGIGVIVFPYFQK